MHYVYLGTRLVLKDPFCQPVHSMKSPVFLNFYRENGIFKDVHILGHCINFNPFKNKYYVLIQTAFVIF